MNYEKDLPLDESGSLTGSMRGVNEEGESVRYPMTLIASGSAYEYLGAAILTTDPGTPAINGFWICTQDGEYTNFGAQTARNLDRFYWNGASWDLIQYSAHLSARLVKDGTTIKMEYWNGSAWAESGSEFEI